MNDPIGDRVEAYLDGELSAEESAAFERDLSQAPVAEAFAQALMVRDMLEQAPPATVPAPLLARIEQDVLAALGAEGREDEAAVFESEGQTGAQAALDALAWTVRGPSLALSGAGAGRAVASGLGHARYALGPLAFSKRGEKKASLGRRGLRLLGRLARRKK